MPAIRMTDIVAIYIPNHSFLAEDFHQALVAAATPPRQSALILCKMYYNKYS